MNRSFEKSQPHKPSAENLRATRAMPGQSETPGHQILEAVFAGLAGLGPDALGLEESDSGQVGKLSLSRLTRFVRHLEHARELLSRYQNERLRCVLAASRVPLDDTERDSLRKAFVKLAGDLHKGQLESEQFADIWGLSSRSAQDTLCAHLGLAYDDWTTEVADCLEQALAHMGSLPEPPSQFEADEVYVARGTKTKKEQSRFATAAPAFSSSAGPSSGPSAGRWGEAREKAQKKAERKLRLESKAAIMEELRASIKSQKDATAEAAHSADGLKSEPTSSEVFAMAKHRARDHVRGTLSWAAAILGVAPACDILEARVHYRERARLWHPDVGNGTSSEAMIWLVEAWEVFKNLKV